MNLEEYKSLQITGKDGYLWNFRYIDPDRREHIKRELMKQLTCDIDINNVIILFPLNAGGSNPIINDIVIDHCTNIICVLSILKKHGIKWKDGQNLDYYNRQSLNAGMVIVEEGLASIATNADPKYPKLHWNKNKESIYWSTPSKREKKLRKILKKQLPEKEIIFSGFFKERFS